MTSIKKFGVNGLPNLGNTCYLNSITQCLLHTTPLVKILIKEEFKKGIKDKTGMVRTLIELSKCMWSNPPSDTLKYMGIYLQTLRLNNDLFKENTQEDSYEALLLILDLIHEKCKYPIKVEINGTPKTRHQNLQYQSIKEWELFFSKGYSDIIDLFYGQLQSTVIDISTKKISNNFDPFNSLSVPVVDNNLYDCLDKYTEQEDTDTGKIKKITFWQLPKVLVISFNRFNAGMRKINTKIEYPLENLDMKKYLTNKSSQETRYNLYAISCHQGSLNYGHYYSYCRVQGSWYKFNDSNVSEVPTREIETEYAYVLFYRRIDVV